MSTPAGHWSTASIEPSRDARRISARSAVGRILRAPFTRQAWTDLGFLIAGFPLALGGFVFNVMQFAHPVLWVVCTPPVRGLGTANRWLALRLFGERIPPPPPMRPEPCVLAKATDAARLASLVSAEGATVKLRSGRIEVKGMPASRLAELAALDGIAVTDLKSHSGWFEAAARDKPAWRTRAYLALKFPVTLCSGPR
jgi:hypothetical protein